MSAMKICRFSCGAPSAVAAKLTVSAEICRIVRIWLAEEHEDNARFMADCEDWIGQKIEVITRDKYNGSIYEVFERERFIASPKGAACSMRLKRDVFNASAEAGDINVLGYTIEEMDRMEDFRENLPDVRIECPLIERGLSKSDCLAMIEDAGIVLPMMYRLGYNNNNCIGCVKGGAGYWNKIRVDFPETFERQAKLQRKLNYSPLRLGTPREMVFLDELAPDAGRGVPEPTIDCSLMCSSAKQEYGG
jgi:hypothetical protein